MKPFPAGRRLPGWAEASDLKVCGILDRFSLAAWAETRRPPGLWGAKGGVFLVAEQGEEELLSGMGTASSLQIWLPSWLWNVSSPVNGEWGFHFEALLAAPPPQVTGTYISCTFLTHGEGYQGEKFNPLPPPPPSHSPSQPPVSFSC